VREIGSASRPRRSAIPIVTTVLGCAVAFAVADAALRPLLPHSLTPLLPLIGVVVGWFAARRRSRADREVPADVPASAATSPTTTVTISPQYPPPDGRSASPSVVIDKEVHESLAEPYVAAMDRIRKSLDGYAVFTEILQGQLRSVTGVSEAAAGSILANLTSVDDKFTALLRFIQEAGSSTEVASVITQIESQMRGCRELLTQFAERQQADAQIGVQQRSRIADDTSRVLEVLEGVNGIARQTSMLSINVSIEAARAGEAGKGFSVIAAEIRKLASEVQALSADVQSRVQALMRTVTVDLQDRVSQREQEERAGISVISQTLVSLTDNLTTIVSHQRDVLQKVEAESATVARPIMDIMGSIQFQDIIRQQLEHLARMAAVVDSHIASITERRDAPGAASDQNTLSSKLDEMYESYVMGEQREAHKIAMGQDIAPKVGSLIEMF